MRLLKLRLCNFQGIRDLFIDTHGNNLSIFGDNATGKTTICSAFMWLLFDKNLEGKKDFHIKTLDSTGNVISGLDHEVEGAFEINGKTLTLRKVYAEQWTKKRGSATSTFTGHTTDYFIDGVPVKKNEYTTKIDSIAKEDIFKLLTSPTFFNEQLHWQKRREILLEVCGDISDEDVIASDKSLSKLPDILQGRKLEDHKKVIAARRSEINKELEKIPVRIDESMRSLPDITGINADELTEKIAFLKTRAQEKNREIARIQSGGQVAELTKSLREVEGRLLDIRNRHRSEVDDKVMDKKTVLIALKGKADTLQQVIRSKEFTITQNNNLICDTETKSEELRKEWHFINDRQFEHNQECNCPVCGQQLPEEKLSEARERALAQFNCNKAQLLEDVTVKGKQRKAEIQRLQSENMNMEKEVTDLQAQLDTVQQTVAGLQTEIDTMTQAATSVTDNPTYIQAVKEKESIEGQIKALEGSTAGLITTVRAEVTSLEAEISTLESKLKDVDHYNNGQVRIEELMAQEKVLAAEFEKLEGELYLTEQFIRSKVALLEEKINSRFRYARFKLFDVQVNGGVVETCETLFDGVPYSGGLNNAARINVGLDIINTLSEHYGFTAPIFVDNAEAVVETIPMRGQMIKLIVSGADKKLRVEVEGRVAIAS